MYWREVDDTKKFLPVLLKNIRNPTVAVSKDNPHT
jgi:hypothetical protein